MQKRYRINNWPEYNKALIGRGRINFWVAGEAVKNWLSCSHTCASGRPNVYADEAILLLLILREVYSLPLRALQGFVESLFQQMGIELPVPSYSQISRRAKLLNKRIPSLLKKGVRDIVFDSTGLKVYGEGEWKVRIHGKSKRRTWRKFHIGIDPNTQDVAVWEMTKNNEGDGEVGEAMLGHVNGRIDKVYGDGAYDGSGFRRAVQEKGGQSIVPPPRNATFKGSIEGWEKERDTTLSQIEGLGGGEEGRALWKKLRGYHVRSLSETFFSRIKRRLGGHLKARGEGQQRTECGCKCLVINKMNQLGMPKGSWEVAA